jgi:hypothetical protein
MAESAVSAPLLGPTAVAIHNDGHMTGQFALRYVVAMLIHPLKNI